MWMEFATPLLSSLRFFIWVLQFYLSIKNQNFIQSDVILIFIVIIIIIIIIIIINIIIIFVIELTTFVKFENLNWDLPKNCTHVTWTGVRLQIHMALEHYQNLLKNEKVSQWKTVYGKYLGTLLGKT